MCSLRDSIEVILTSFYKKQFTQKRVVSPFLKHSDISNITGCPQDVYGLGDTVVLTPFIGAKRVSSEAPSFPTLVKYNKNSLARTGYSGFSKDNNRKYGPVVNIAEYAKYDWGGGHAIQRITRALGLPEKDKPQGVLDRAKHIPVAGRIGYHLSGNQDIHSIALENLRIFDSYKENHQEYEWHDLSSFFPLGKLIDFLSTCEYFIGINSGPMHLAAALGVKSIIIVNSPSPELLHLPKIKETEIPDLEWLYPQNVHLHTAGSNELVPFFSEDSLGDSLNGKSYPYFKDDFLDIGRKYYERI